MHIRAGVHYPSRLKPNHINHTDQCYIQELLLLIRMLTAYPIRCLFMFIREVEGEIFKLEMLLEDVKEKINKGKYTSAVSLSGSSPPIIPDDLASTSSPPSNEVITATYSLISCQEKCFLCIYRILIHELMNSILISHENLTFQSLMEPAFKN